LFVELLEYGILAITLFTKIANGFYMQVERKRVGLVFLLEWILATTLGITIGKFFGTLLGFFSLRAGFTGAFAIAGFVVGIMVGFLQQMTLKRQQVNQIDLWGLATGFGGGLGGLVTGTIIFTLPSNIAFYVGSTVAGVVTGTAIGVMQWLLLKRSVYKARWWILANIIGWTVGEVLLWAVIVGVMDGGRVTVNGVVTGLLELKGESVILLSSAVTGAIAGVPLLWLLRSSGEIDRNAGAN
jgi:hypothetical protein